MKKIGFFAALFLVLTLVLASGCVHFDYEGEAAPETGMPITTISRETELPVKTRKLGRAVAWGDYRDVSRDRLADRLEAEAAERGANTVRITAEQVVPAGTAVQLDPAVVTMDTVNSDNTSSMNRLQRDFDGGYGKAELFGKNERPAERNAIAGARDYTRIIRAEFLICDPPVKTAKRQPASEARSEAKPQARPETVEAVSEAKPKARAEAVEAVSEAKTETKSEVKK